MNLWISPTEIKGKEHFPLVLGTEVSLLQKSIIRSSSQSCRLSSNSLHDYLTAQAPFRRCWYWKWLSVRVKLHLFKPDLNFRNYCLKSTQWSELSSNSSYLLLLRAPTLKKTEHPTFLIDTSSHSRYMAAYKTLSNPQQSSMIEAQARVFLISIYRLPSFQKPLHMAVIYDKN